MSPLRRNGRPLIFSRPSQGEESYLAEKLGKETVGGAVALVAAALAVVWANTAFGDAYFELRSIQLGPLDLAHWAADGALTIFFFVAGLELKREFVVGSLRRPADAAVPVVAACCGVAVPALIYVVVNAMSQTGEAGGWAIPAATDIAFALAVLAVVGSSLPTSLRAFLLTLAVVDDLIVIIIIAVFFTSSLTWWAFGLALAGFAAYAVLQKLRLTSPLLTVPVALASWWFLFESGVHATIAGVALGLLTRVKPDPHETVSPAEALENRLSPISAGLAVPFFAFMSAGVYIGGLEGMKDLITHPISLGVVLGLLLGKPIGVFGGSYLVTRLTRAQLADDIGWRDILGVSLLAGIGFTVSLLVAELSFSEEIAQTAKAAVLAGSLLAAILGALVLSHRNKVHARFWEAFDGD